MSKYIIFILIFNVFCFVQNSDTYSISDRKTVDIISKRQLIEPLPDSKNVIQPVDNTEGNNNKNLSSTTVLRDEKSISKKDVTKKESDSVTTTNTNKKKEAENEHSPVHAEDNKPPTAVNEHEESKKNSSVTVNDSSVNPPDGNIKKVHGSSEHPGAMLRGFYVFLGLSIIIIIYFIIKAFRLRPGAPAPATVRKYGIVGRRSDMEMLPLPLAEEEDDDTLFDMGSQVNR